VSHVAEYDDDQLARSSRCSWPSSRMPMARGRGAEAWIGPATPGVQRWESGFQRASLPIRFAPYFTSFDLPALTAAGRRDGTGVFWHAYFWQAW
jgi:hypothetical protein